MTVGYLSETLQLSAIEVIKQLMRNGIMANMGAGAYKLQPGDVEHWDFHGWSFNAFVPAVIGSFPQPFLSGFRGKKLPTIVVYQEGLEKTAMFFC